MVWKANQPPTISRKMKFGEERKQVSPPSSDLSSILPHLQEGHEVDPLGGRRRWGAAVGGYIGARAAAQPPEELREEARVLCQRHQHLSRFGIEMEFDEIFRLECTSSRR